MTGNSRNYEDQVTIVREGQLVEKVVFIDGLAGCGKTMLSPIVSAMERVELLTYSYEIEYICTLCYLGKISKDAAAVMVRLFADLKLYNTMMSRETNFRYADLSSVFKYSNPLQYIKRLFQKGDETVPSRIRSERPILNLVVHDLLAFSEPIFLGLGSKACFIEVVRHPLYMIRQISLNMQRLIGTERDFIVYFLSNQRPLPYYSYGWEDIFHSSSPMDKSIYYIENLLRMTNQSKKHLKEKYDAQILTVPFENFVLNPWSYIDQIEKLLDSKVTPATKRMMKKQNVPREMYAEGVDMKIYKRVGWGPPKPGSDESAEFELRRKYAEERASDNALLVLDRLCNDYEEKYLGRAKETGFSEKR